MSVEADRGETYDGNEKGRSFLISLSCGCPVFRLEKWQIPGIDRSDCIDNLPRASKNAKVMVERPERDDEDGIMFQVLGDGVVQRCWC